MRTIIFSKDRPCQLQALLESLFENINGLDITVIYKASDEYFAAAYTKLYSGFNFNVLKHKIKFYKEDNFQDQVMGLLRDTADSYVMFLVDDIIFKNKIDLKEAVKEMKSSDICYSLRLYQGIDYCYPTSQNIKSPSFIETANPEILRWNWKGAEGDWGYPLSVDGHIFKTDFIRKLAGMIKFNNPNTFEAGLAAIADRFSPLLPTMACSKFNSALVNIPVNRVQNQFQNRFWQGVSAKELNQQYLEGKKINWQKIQGVLNKAPHEEIELELV